MCVFIVHGPFECVCVSLQLRVCVSSELFRSFTRKSAFQTLESLEMDVNVSIQWKTTLALVFIYLVLVCVHVQCL